MLTIWYTNKNDKLKHAEFKGQSTAKYMLKGNYIQYYELNGKGCSYLDAMAIIEKAAAAAKELI